MATETARRVSISILLKHLCGKILLCEPACDIEICALCSCAFAASPHFVYCLCSACKCNCTKLPLRNTELVTRTLISASRWLSVLWSRLVALSLCLRTEGTLLRVRKPDNPHRSAHDETLQHARTTRWCQQGWVFLVDRHCLCADEVSQQV